MRALKGVDLLVTCAGPSTESCTVKAQLVTPARGKRLRAGKGPALSKARTTTLAGGAKATLRLRLTPAALRTLGAHRSLRALVRLTESVNDGGPVTRYKALTFKK